MIVYCSLSLFTNNRDKLLDEITVKIGEFRVANNLHGTQITLNYLREHDEYMVDRVRQADVLLVTHPDNKFDFDYGSIPASVRKDIEYAKANKKRIFLLYRTKDGVLSIYDTACGSTDMTGISGTTRRFWDFLKDNITDKIVIGSVPDNRGAQEQREYHAQYGNLQAQRQVQQKAVAQIGIQPIPILEEKVLKEIDLSRSHDRRLLI